MKKNKASKVLELLKNGVPAREIMDRIKVSSSYVYMLKKKTGIASFDKLDTLETMPLNEVGLPEEDFNELLYQITRGRQARVWADASSVDATLDARAEQYGTFYDVASLSQGLKNAMMAHLQKHGKTLVVDQQEALEFILSKIARILNGDPNYADNWIDIAGYAKLVAERLQGNAR
jgi:hypothetical protein